MASCIAWVRSRTCRRLSATCSSPTAKASKGTNSLIRRATEPRSAWPELAYKSWQDTCATLHLWTQVVGKVRLALTPPDQSLVERDPLCHRARAHHRGDAVSRPHAADRL